MAGVISIHKEYNLNPTNWSSFYNQADCLIKIHRGARIICCKAMCVQEPNSLIEHCCFIKAQIDCLKIYDLEKISIILLLYSKGIQQGLILFLINFTTKLMQIVLE